MKVGDLVKTYAGMGIILQYRKEWDKPLPHYYPWYVWMTKQQEIRYFKTEDLEVISEGG